MIILLSVFAFYQSFQYFHVFSKIETRKCVCVEDAAFSQNENENCVCVCVCKILFEFSCINVRKAMNKTWHGNLTNNWINKTIKNYCCSFDNFIICENIIAIYLCAKILTFIYLCAVTLLYYYSRSSWWQNSTTKNFLYLYSIILYALAWHLFRYLYINKIIVLETSFNGYDVLHTYDVYYYC